MGCSVKRPLPALVQLKSDNKFCKIMAGVRSTGTVKIYIDGEEISRDTGEIQYTDYGISGIPVFQVSRFAVRGVFEKKKVTAAIDMISDIEYDDIASDIEMRIKREPQKTIEQFFAGIVNKKLVSAAAKSAAHAPSRPRPRRRRPVQNAARRIRSAKRCRPRRSRTIRTPA